MDVRTEGGVFTFGFREMEVGLGLIELLDVAETVSLLKGLS